METPNENYLAHYNMSCERISEQCKIENLEYSTCGKFFSYTADSSLKIHSTSIPAVLKNIITVKIDTMKYFQKNTLIYSKDNSIFYLSVYDNKYLRSFEGHNDSISSLSVDQHNDRFMSVGTDTIKIWDIRHKDPVYTLDSKGKLGALSKDHEYALADNNFVYLFDLRNSRGYVEIKSIKPGFTKKLWYTPDQMYLGVSSLKCHQFISSKEATSNVAYSLENPCDGDIFRDSNIFVTGSSKMLFAYKIADKKTIGRMGIPDFECSTIRANPNYPQFVCSSGHSIRIWSILN